MSKKRSVITNNGATDYSEIFHDKRYVIPAGGSIELPRHEAIAFFGNYAGYNVEKPLSIKHIVSADDDAAAESFQCHLCGVTLGNQKLFDKHMEDAHAGDRKTQKMYACKFCSFKTANRKDFIAHIKTHKEQKAADLIDALE